MTTLTGGAGVDSFEISAGRYGATMPELSAVTIADLETDETIALNVRYADPDPTTGSPAIPPEVTVEEDPDTNETRILIDGEVALVVAGHDSPPDGTLNVTLSSYDPYEQL